MDNYSAPVAQLDRVLGFEPRGWGFESLRAHICFCTPEETRTLKGDGETKVSPMRSTRTAGFVRAKRCETSLRAHTCFCTPEETRTLKGDGETKVSPMRSTRTAGFVRAKRCETSLRAH